MILSRPGENGRGDGDGETMRMIHEGRVVHGDAARCGIFMLFDHRNISQSVDLGVIRGV